MSEIDDLKTFLQHHAPNVGDAGVTALVNAIMLEKDEDAGGTRSVQGEQRPDGTVIANSLKPYNILNVSFRDLIPAFLKGGALFLTLESRVAAVAAFLELLAEFWDKFKIEFDGEDARMLLAIWALEDEMLNARRVAESYAREFGETVSPEQVAPFLEKFAELRVLEDLREGVYEKRERMTFKRWRS